MTDYINAHQGKAQASVQYNIDNLSAEQRSGGNQAWRHNNPGLLPFNLVAKQNDALGQAYGIAIFPDKDQGESAFKAHCQSAKFSGFTLGQMIAHFIPDYYPEPPEYDEETKQAILPWIESETGLDMNAPLTDYDRFYDLVHQHIGWQSGNTETIEKDTETQAQQVATVSGNNLIINGKTAVHQGSNGILQTVDVCWTPIGKVDVPIPYANIARSSDAASTASSVKINGNPACNLKSNFSQSTGDQPGKMKGIVSGTLQGKAEFILGSFNVLIEGKPAVRQGDLMISNSKNTPPAPLNQPPGVAPSSLSVNNRQALADKDNISAKASYSIDASADNLFIGQGGIERRQGAFNAKKVFSEGS
ncbi:DUF4150 domain-containing protein [Catenovulum sp. SM1970]|uniref:PAAR-like domain-containing protein n=1 Tax=Marinifaba aquimaris TaxID=2741323 RepID=UPI001572DDE9|nr:DUF4150 domain-containing protein [Marinifaba aquimaris]